MTGVWVLVGVVGVATIALKGAGAALLAGRPLPATFGRMVALLAPGLLAALIVVQIFTAGDRVALDARAVGLTAAAIALIARAPILLVVATAALATALARAAGLT
ncbi:MAG: AzlD domain-containing protein [Solirubrobacteraceae bacterium]